MQGNMYLQFFSMLCLLQVSKLQEQVNGPYQHAAVATDVGQCSTLGRDVLQRGGSAVDARCSHFVFKGVVNPQSSGIGGGFSMLVYINKTKRSVALMAAERAPEAASADMFPDREASKYGVKTIAVPGEVLGMWEAHKLFGKLPWADLFMPVIQMAETGFQVTSHLPFAVRQMGNHPFIRKMYSGENGGAINAGDNVTSPRLAMTLRKIALYGPQVFYTGSVAHDMLQDIREAGGIITPADFATYNVLWKPVATTFFKNNLTMFSTPLTSSGPVLQYMLNVLDEYNITNEDFSNFDKKLRLYHRFLEIGKFAFALRNHLGDDPTSTTVRKILSTLRSKQFAKITASLINDTSVTFSNRHEYDISDDIFNEAADGEEAEGLGDTSHVSVLAENGDAVSFTTSLGYYFGSKFYSQRTGVFLNNHMANFYFPNRESSPIWRWPSTANGIAPNRRYMTTVCPSILVDDKGNVKMVVGASGGLRIVATNAWVILRVLWMGATLKDAIDEKRICSYLATSNSAYFEQGFPKELSEQLAAMGHLTKYSASFAVSQTILRDQREFLDAYSDPRKGGHPDGY